MATLRRMSPVLLAFDTSTEVLSVALCWPGGELAWNGEGGAQASQALLPRIRAQMSQAGLGWTDLAAIAYGRGPGAFTGLRTACSVAQGLAFGAGRPVLPLDSLLVVAEDARAQCVEARDHDTTLDVGVAMDARMSELYTARYRWDGARWAARSEPALCAPDAVLRLWTGAAAGMPQVLAGNGLSLLPANADLAGMARLETSVDRAAALLRLARAAWAAGDAVDAAQALPIYVRDKVALTTTERAAQAAARNGGTRAVA